MLDDLAPGEVREVELLVAFFDIAGFARHARSHIARTIFDICARYFERAGDIIEEGGGRLIKTIGDAGLVLFDDAEPGIAALRTLQTEAEAWLVEQGWQVRILVKAHYGPVACGFMGPHGDKRLDVYGETVNMAALVAPRDHGFAMTPEVFRRLSPATQRLYTERTPPIVYVPLEAGEA